MEVFPEFAGGIKDLDGFERIRPMYWFDRATEQRLVVKPYREETPGGIFATRAPFRPNPIGFSSVRLLKIESRLLRVGDVDVLDQTPLLDIKPCVPVFDVYPVSRSGWPGGAIPAEPLPVTVFST